MKRLRKKERRIKLTLIDAMAYGLFLIRLRVRYKHTQWVLNDLTAYNSGVQEIDLSQPIYIGENIVYCQSVPLYNIEQKAWAKRIRTGSVVTLDDDKFKHHLFDVGGISESGLVTVRSKSDIRVVKMCYASSIKNVIKE